MLFLRGSSSMIPIVNNFLVFFWGIVVGDFQTQTKHVYEYLIGQFFWKPLDDFGKRWILFDLYENDRKNFGVIWLYIRVNI